GPVTPLLPFVPDPPVGPIGPVAPVGPTELGPVGPVGPRGPVAPAGGSIVKSNSRCFLHPSSDGVMTTLPDPPDTSTVPSVSRFNATSASASHPLPVCETKNPDPNLMMLALTVTDSSQFFTTV